MKILVATLLLLLPIIAPAQAITKMNQETKALQVEVAALKVEVASLKAQHALMIQDTANIISNVDARLRYDLVLACEYNKKVDTWKGVLIGLTPIPIPANLPCPAMPVKVYPPYWISKDGPPIPQ